MYRQDAARQYIDDLIAEREALAENRNRALPWLISEARGDAIGLMAHDPASADDIAAARERNATVAEFPTTVDSADAARRSGLRTVCGAPNVIRDGTERHVA